MEMISSLTESTPKEFLRMLSQHSNFDISDMDIWASHSQLFAILLAPSHSRPAATSELLTTSTSHLLIIAKLSELLAAHIKTLCKLSH
jgi:hypothetical protein